MSLNLIGGKTGFMGKQDYLPFPHKKTRKRAFSFDIVALLIIIRSPVFGKLAHERSDLPWNV